MTTTIRYNTTTFGSPDLNVHFPTPADEDDIRFLAGGDVLTDSLSQPGIDFVGVRQWPGSSVSMAEGSFLICDIDNSGTGILEYLGYGPRFNHGGGTGGVVAKVNCSPKGGGTLGLGFAACTYGKVGVFAGKLLCYTLGVITTLWMGLNGRADIRTCATAITTANAHGRSYTNCQRNVTTLNLGDDATWVTGAFSKTYATVNMSGGIWRPDFGGTVSTTANLLAGIIDCSKMTKDLDISGATVTLGASLKIIPSLSGAKIIWPAETAITFPGDKPEGYCKSS